MPKHAIQLSRSGTSLREGRAPPPRPAPGDVSFPTPYYPGKAPPYQRSHLSGSSSPTWEHLGWLWGLLCSSSWSKNPDIGHRGPGVFVPTSEHRHLQPLHVPLSWDSSQWCACRGRTVSTTAYRHAWRSIHPRTLSYIFIPPPARRSIHGDHALTPPLGGATADHAPPKDDVPDVIIHQCSWRRTCMHNSVQLTSVPTFIL